MTRPDAEAKLHGTAVYGTDLEAPGMLWGALVLAPVAHGRILRRDFRRARAMPDVVAVVGPDEVRELFPKADLEGESPVFPKSEIHYLNQPVAAVAARSRESAIAAARAVVLQTEPLPVASDVEDIFPEWPGPEVKDSPYVTAHVHARHGDVEAAFRDAELVHSETYRTSGVAQVAIEPHACLAEADGKRWRITTSTQTPFGVRDDLASALGAATDRFVVQGSWVGGGFGGKGSALLEPYAVVLAAAAKAPVKLELGYHEEFLLGRSTLPSVVRLDTALRGGEITGRRVRLLLDSGASLPGRDFATGWLIGFLLGPYRTPAYDIEGFGVRTNKPPFGPHRAPFAPQCTFIVESHIDGLAHRLGVDPIEFRLKHAWRKGDETHFGQKVGPFALVAGLERAREIVQQWRQGLVSGHGIGVGAGFWSTGVGAGGEARLVLQPNGLRIQQVETDIGSGSVERGLVAVAERVLGLPREAIRVERLSTADAPFDSGVFGSRTVAALGQAVEKAANSLKETVRGRLKASGDWSLSFVEGRVVVRSGRTRQPLEKLFTPAERKAGGLTAEARHYGRSGKIDESRVVTGNFYPHSDYCASVHVAEVSVDRETGAVQVIRYAAIQDPGVVLDPTMVRGQVEGGVVMGLGEALSEETMWDASGRLLNPGLLDYRIPTMGEVPPIEVIPLEGFPGAGPFGAKGIGEPPIIPVIGTVANAVCDATGARVLESPLSAERVARALKLL